MRKLIGLGVLSLTLSSLVCAASPTLKLDPDSTLTVIGDSTLHTFASRATQLTLQGDLSPQLAPATATSSDIYQAVVQKNALNHLQLSIPVKGLKSHEAALDKNMYKSLKSEEFPEIVFELERYVVSSSTAGAAYSHVQVLGKLSIAGHPRTVTIDGEAGARSGGVRFEGDYALLMSDYGIKPPTMMMGTVKVKDRVIIRFDVVLEAGSEALKK